ncbi:ATP-dependent RNA helicase DEAH13-like isoform X4 [Primulina eburnea]
MPMNKPSFKRDSELSPLEHSPAEPSVSPSCISKGRSSFALSWVSLFYDLHSHFRNKTRSNIRARVFMMPQLDNLDLGTDLTRAGYGGGDIIMLPGKKKKEKRVKKQVPNRMMNKPKELSKSQKRKLKKLEEDKDKETLLEKSIDILERYKIRDDVYSLMCSSRNLGQVETALEKRRREANFLKAGLELAESDRPLKKRTSDDPSFHVEQCENILMPQPINDLSNLKRSTAEKEAMHDATVSAKEMVNETIAPSRTELSQKPVPSSCIYEEIMKLELKPVDTLHRDPKNSLAGPSNQDNCYFVRSLCTPTVVHVSRPKEVEMTRRDLPIVMMEQEIMEAINDHNSVIICGETGCGKTTQVPQFLYEAGFGPNHVHTRRGIIGVTQPRRVAVLATAKRVAFELGLRLGKEVGFQVRHDRRIGDNCSIKFMTDGILLRELQNDFLLKRYSVIILDEAHERSLNTDILIGMLSRVIKERQREFEEQHKRIISGETIEFENRIYPLKLVLMSATLRVEDFVSERRLFHDPPPIIEVPTRQYPVTIHFSKRTEIVDYIGQAFKKVMSIHKKLPPGGILVFVTGLREVEYLCRKLRRSNKTFSVNEEKPSEEIDMKEITDAFDCQGDFDDETPDHFSVHMEENHGNLLEDEYDNTYNSSEESDLEFYSDDENYSKSMSAESDGKLVDILGVDGGIDSLKAAFEALARKNGPLPDNTTQNVTKTLEGGPKQSSSIAEKSVEDKVFCTGALRVLPLYAMLPAPAQLRVFEEVKEEERLVVVATNVAETSLTIPGIRYVVDTGREKVKIYNSSNGMESYEIQWISKASAAQRAGRSGRTGPGHCYRLYSSAVFNNMFPDFSSSEILKVPVDGVVLLMKSMHIGKVANFPFPTPPETNALVEAENCLKVLEALDSNGRLTPLGRAMSLYPMNPRHSRMLLTVIQTMQKVKDSSRASIVLGYAVATAAALSSSNPFIMQVEGSHIDSNDSKHAEKDGSLESENIRDKGEKARRKKLKEIAKASREKFCNPTSDALTIACALQCFELSENPVEFCSESALHYKTMEEMSKLRKQVLQLVFSSSKSDLQRDFLWTHGTLKDVECSWKIPSNKHHLLLNEEDILAQAICAGWADRVARRIKAASVVLDGERKVKSVRYQACMVKETVFLHRWSSVSKSPPEFLVYNDLLYSKRPFIHGATSVRSNWLLKYAQPLCSFSAPLSDPKPYYDPITDQVFSWVTPTFGPHLWQLPLHGLPIKDNFNRVVVFACSLLEGQVLPCLKAVRKYLAVPPSSILKREALGLKRVGNLLSKMSLRGRVIDSCTKLRNLWNENPAELFPEIRDLFQEGFHMQFEELWVVMLHQINLDQEERFPVRAKGEKRKKLDFQVIKPIFVCP